jgi:hypothetical protein
MLFRSVSNFCDMCNAVFSAVFVHFILIALLFVNI